MKPFEQLLSEFGNACFDLGVSTVDMTISMQDSLRLYRKATETRDALEKYIQDNTVLPAQGVNNNAYSN